MDIRLDDLSKDLGFTVDPADITGSLKRVYDAQNEKIATLEKAGEPTDLDARIATALEKALGGVGDNAPNPEPPKRKDINDLPDTGRRAAEIISKARVMPGTFDEWQGIMHRPAQDATEKALQDFNDGALLCKMGFNRAPQDLKAFQRVALAHPDLMKSVTSDGSAGYGVEWAPDGFSGQLNEDIRLQTLVSNLFVNATYTGPGDAFADPFVAGSSTAYIKAQATDINSVTNPTTGANTVTLVPIGAATAWSTEFDEDVVFSALPIFRNDVSRTLAEGQENAILNGVKTGTSAQDSDVTAAYDVRFAWHGLRYLCLRAAATMTDGSTWEKAAFLASLVEMGKYGINVNDLACIVGPRVYGHMRGFTDIFTMDKYGALATVLTGEVAKYLGVPIILSGQMRETLNSSGVYDNTTKTKATAQLVNRRMFRVWQKRAITLEQDRFILAGYTLLVATARWSFSATHDVNATYPCADLIYNITS